MPRWGVLLLGLEMSKSYEDLSGARGERRNFRPIRASARSIFQKKVPVVWFNDEELSLENISVNGVGCVAHSSIEEHSALPSDLGILRFTQNGQEIFRCSATKVRSAPAHEGTFIGLTLVDQVLRLDELAMGNATILALTPPVASTEMQPSQAYKSFCAEVLAFVGGYLDRIDLHLEPIADKLSYKEENELVLALVDAAREPWRKILCDGNRLVIATHNDPEMRSALKTFTEKVVTRELVGGASWARSYFKPMGYPGDYQIMNYMYDHCPEGASLRAKFLHMLGVVAGEPIVSRMQKLASLIVDTSNQNQQASDATRIMSIGCGPARELEPILSQSPKTQNWVVTLVDQEVDALHYAVSNALRLDERARLKTNALNISFKEMMTGAGYRAEIGNQDVVYSAGLVDYFSPLLAMRFVNRMYDFLKPGGRLIIGNVNMKETGTLWAMDYVLDWSLYFRNEEEMMAMARDLPKGAKVEIVPDALDAVLFLVVSKPH